MTSSGHSTTPELDALLSDGTLAGSWVLEASKSEIRLRSKSMWGLSAVKGVFRQVAGSGTVSATGDASGTITVAAESVDTNNKKRDEHLRSADFFNVASYPDITVQADQVRPSGQGVTVTGSLTVRDRTRPVSFDARISSADSGEIWLDGEVQVNRADFGLVWNQLGMTSMNNTITVHAVFTRK
ncbi:MAG: YceI family protein [Streptosporangiaceae bacterium]